MREKVKDELWMHAPHTGDALGKGCRMFVAEKRLKNPQHSPSLRICCIYLQTQREKHCDDQETSVTLPLDRAAGCVNTCSRYCFSIEGSDHVLSAQCESIISSFLSFLLCQHLSQTLGMKRGNGRGRYSKMFSLYSSCSSLI